MSLRVDVNVGIDSGDASLATDVYRPSGTEPVTVIVTRTMYGKARHLHEGRAWVRRGYGFVVQDVRGRYESEGVWEPYSHERADGARLLEWLRPQPWVGDIVLLGGSYNAYCAWAAAVTVPDAVCGVISLAPAMGFHAVKFDPSGVLRLDEHVHWWVDHAAGRVDRAGWATAMSGADPSIVAHLPVIGIGPRLWVDASGWQKVVEDGPRPGPEAIGDAELCSLDVNSLHVCGWYDLVVADAVHHWQTLATGSGPRRHILVLGPWDHDLTLAGHPPDAQVFASEPFDLGATIAAWLRQIGAGRPAVEARVLPIGSTRWMHSDAWPPRSADARDAARWYASPVGVLHPRATAAGNVRFTDDPSDPVPSVVAGWDRRHLEHRGDVARFTSAPLDDTLIVAGSPSVSLWACSTSPASDWIVRLAVVRTDGRIAEIVSGTYVSSRHQLAGVTIDLAPCSAVIEPGSRLRLEIAGTDFPRLARNPGTDADRYHSSEIQASTRTVVTGGDTATSLSLPLADGGDHRWR